MYIKNLNTYLSFYQTINSIFSPFNLTLLILSMKLLHSTIQRSQKVLHAIPLTSSEPNIINTLLIFRNYAQKIKIDCNESVPSIDQSEIYPLGVPICHITQFGELIAAVTTDAFIVFFSPDQPFKTIMNYQLTNRISPSQIPIAHVLPSINHKFLVCCGFSKNCYVISNMETNFAQIRIELPDFVVLGVAPGSTDNIFAFLVMNSKSERFVILIDITSQQYNQINQFSVSSDTYKILSSNQGNTILAFSKTEITSLENGNTIKSSIISSHFFITPTYLIYQTIDGNMFGLNTTDFNVAPMGTFPLSSLFYLLSPTLLLSVSEHRDCYFISLPSPIDPLSTHFEELPNQSMDLTPRIISSIFNDRSLIVASGYEDESCITQIQNTVQFNRRFLTKINLDDEKDIKPQLFCTSNDTILLSSVKTVPIIGQAFNYSENQTILIGRFNNHFIQIHRKGINVLLENDTEKMEEWKHWESQEEISCAAIGEECCFVSIDNGNRAIVLDSEFNILTDKVVGQIYAATFCDKRDIAIATRADGTEHSTISIYSNDLNPGDLVIHITSQVVNMIYDQKMNELYASTQEGLVYKFDLDKNDKNTIFSGKVTPFIYPFSEAVLIFAEKTLIYKDPQFLALSATVNDSPPVSVTTCDNKLFELENDGTISEITVDKFETDFKTQVFTTKGTPRRMANLGDVTLTVSKSHEGDQLNSFISLLSRKNPSEEEFQNINVQINSNQNNQEGFEIVSILVVPDSEQAILGCQRKKKIENINQIKLLSQGQLARNNQLNEYFLNIIQFNKTQNTPNGGIEPTLIQSLPIDDRPNVLSFIKGIVLVGSGRHIYPMFQKNEKWIFDTDGLASIHTQVGFIGISDNIVWVGDKTQSVICFAFKTYDKNQPKLVPIACDTEPKQLTAMQVLDKYQIAVADRFGTISILKLPDDIIANSPWRASHMPERGIFMPQCGHLIKIASYNVGEAITSLMKSKYNDALFYTSLLGQIGILVPIPSEEDYMYLQAAENLTNQQWQKDFSLMKLCKFQHLKVSVVSLDAIELIDQLSDESKVNIENLLVQNHKITIQQVLGILAKYKTLCKF